MNYIGKFITNFREFYNEINSATLTGAIDVVVIEQPDGTFLCSPFHVRFGKIGVLRSREKVVDIEVNGEPIDIHMKLGESGEAFFVEEAEGNVHVPSYLATSPIPMTTDIAAELEKLKAEAKLQSIPPRHNAQKKPENNNNVEDNLENTPPCTPCSNVQIKLNSDNENILNCGSPQVNISVKSVNCIVLQHESEACGSRELQAKTSFLNESNFMPIKDSPPGDTSIGIQTDLLEDAIIAEESSEQIKSIYEQSKPQDSAETTTVIIEENALEDAKVKRRRRKKSAIKRRPRSREIPVPSIDKNGYDSRESASDPEIKAACKEDAPAEDQEEIFQMDEDYQSTSELTNHLLSRSVSLPASVPNASFISSWKLKKLSATFAGELHPFSDGDVTPNTSPRGSRPPSPKSDTEFEIQKLDATSQTEVNNISWGWGQLPIVSRKSSEGKWRKKSQEQKTEIHSSDDEEPKSDDSSEAQKRSMLSGMLNFMRSTKKMRHMPESEGIYLDDLNPDDLDPEVAALYFPKFRSQFPSMKSRAINIKDDDTESGNGTSLPQSPNSVEGAIGGQHLLDSDCEDRQLFYDYCSKNFGHVEMSLCGGLQDYDGDIPHEQFQHMLVTYDNLCENPSIIQNPDLVIKLGGKFYNWQTAGPMILSMAVFRKPLPEKTTSQLITNHMPKKKKVTYSSWWRWGRAAPETSKKDELLSDGEKTNQDLAHIISTTPTTDATTINQPLDSFSTENGTFLMPEVSKGINIERSSNLSLNVHIDIDVSPKLYQSEKFKKTLRLSSQQIASLRLKEGPNEVLFSVTTAYQGTTRCKCNVYRWRYDDKIIISDVDGTITKSDVLGHILPIIGQDWAQSGVASLFTKIKNNNYQFLYLSARAIGQARITRDYLRSVKQGDVCLPDGPLLLSPTSLINAFHREVIEKKPEEFKISCLKDIQALFPKDEDNPFYAGFGNKINDTWAYRAVHIPISRIFTINHRGELKLQELIQTFQSSYTRLSDVADHVFPPLQRRSSLNGHLSANFSGPERFSSFTYWRLPLPDLPEVKEETVKKDDEK